MRKLLLLLRVWWSDRAAWIVDMRMRQAILDAAGPLLVEDPRLKQNRCTECGALESPCSPPMIDHAPGCPGWLRYEMVKEILCWGDQI
jgi:hypothetical protein